MYFNIGISGALKLCFLMVTEEKYEWILKNKLANLFSI